MTFITVIVYIAHLIFCKISKTSFSINGYLFLVSFPPVPRHKQLLDLNVTVPFFFWMWYPHKITLNMLINQSCVFHLSVICNLTICNFQNYPWLAQT